MSRFDTINTAQSYGTTGLGVAGSIAAVSAHGAAATGAAGALVAIGSAATVVGLIATPVIILLGRIFHGADPRQVPASQIEQAFEAAANNLYAVGKAGMISRAEAADGMRVFLKKGLEFFARRDIVLGPAEEKGKANLKKVIEAEIAAALRDLAEARTASLDVMAAKRLYVPRGRAGWYPESIEPAAKLTNLYLDSLPKNVIEKATAAVRSQSLLTWVGVGVAALLGMAGGRR